MKTINDFNFAGKRALVRVDFNVPLDHNLEVADDTRIRAALPTIQKILNDGGSLVLASHLGRPKNGPESKFSLKPVADHLGELIGRHVHFSNNTVGEEAESAADRLAPGEILLVENTRFYKEETKGDPDFARRLAQLGNVYVNDAFGTAHRAHASTTIAANYFDPDNKMFGLLMAGEVENASRVLNNHEKPFTTILGGAKVSDKILLIQNLLEKADNILIGGGMTYTFVKAAGGEIGNSLCEDDKLDLARELIENARVKGVNLVYPTDNVIADAFSNEANRQLSSSGTISPGWMGLDIGKETVSAYSDIIANSKTILWNGPMGVFEMENFQNGTRKVAESIAGATKNGAFSLIGGGDSVAAINKFKLADQVSFVSTGGGAMLEFFEGKTLPGIAAIQG